MIVLDADVLADGLRNFSPAVQWFRSVAGEVVVVPGFAAMELSAGCRDKGEQAVVNRLLSRFRIVWPVEARCNAALADHKALHLSHGTGILDCLIGHTAMALGEPLHTFNVKHYAPIRGLRTIQPYKR